MLIKQILILFIFSLIDLLQTELVFKEQVWRKYIFQLVEQNL